MEIKTPDPRYTTSPRSRANFVLACKLALGFAVVMWVVFLVDHIFGLRLARFGLWPREPAGLLGLLTVPLLHGNLGHIAANTVPLLVGGAALLYLYPHSSLRALPVLYSGTTLLAWTFARAGSTHIGASGFVYGILTYVFVAGVLRRDMRAVGVSLLIWFLYGSYVWGIFPDGSNTSWELHLSGMVLGVVMAWLYRNWDRPPIRRYSWELEEDDGDEPHAQPWRDDWK